MTNLDDDFIEAGIECTELIANPTSWINRRVETIEMLSKEETRRRVSVDFTLSDEQREELRTRHGSVVPISVLSKHPRHNFDLRDEGGAAVPVLGRRDNGELALIALLSAALDALPKDPSDDLLEMLTADLRQIIFGDEEASATALSFFVGSADAGDPARKAIWDDGRCQSLLRTLASDYVLFAALPCEGPSRRVLKFSYGDDLPLDPTWTRLRDKYAPQELWWRVRFPDCARFLIDCPGAWRACSFHMEIAIPQELRARYAALGRVVEDDDEADIEFLGKTDKWASRVALYAQEPIEPHDDVRAYVVVVSEREGGATRAALTGVGVALLLWLGWLSGLDFKDPDAAVSILLAGAAVLSGFTAATGRHAIVSRIFRSRRRALVVVAVAALAGSASLAMELAPPTLRDVWLAGAIVCSLVALRLCWSAIRAAR
jgi:hypothetical protein